MTGYYPSKGVNGIIDPVTNEGVKCSCKSQSFLSKKFVSISDIFSKYARINMEKNATSMVLEVIVVALLEMVVERLAHVKMHTLALDVNIANQEFQSSKASTEQLTLEDTEAEHFVVRFSK